MFSKCVQFFLKVFSLSFILTINLFFKMFQNRSECEKDSNSLNQLESYTFKPFDFQKITPNPECKVPFPRSGHRIGADSSNLYSFGGYNPWIRTDENDDDEFYWTYPLFQELWKFNFASKQWIKYPNSHSLPNELASSALILRGNILMVF